MSDDLTQYDARNDRIVMPVHEFMRLKNLEREVRVFLERGYLKRDGDYLIPALDLPYKKREKKSRKPKRKRPAKS
jgi:hypothetical protein